MAAGTYTIAGTISSVMSTGDFFDDSGTYTLDENQSGTVTIGFTTTTNISLSGDITGTYILATLPSGFQATSTQMAIQGFGGDVTSASIAIAALSINQALPTTFSSPVSLTYTFNDVTGGGSWTLVFTAATGGGGYASIGAVVSGPLSFYGVWDDLGVTLGPSTGWYRSDVPGIPDNVAATQITS